jgi:CheY-like chemotaxis protein
MARVLIIDDHDDLRELVQFVLDDAGYATATAADGASGIAVQRENPADLLITDIFMPNQDGIETIAQFRSEFPNVRIIAVSGGGKASHAEGYLRTALQIGADAVLSKPFEQDELIALVRSVLAREVAT